METPPRLTEVEKAWLAAIMDGEGTIGVYRSKRKRNKSGWRFSPSLTFTNTDKRLIDRFVELTEPYITRVRYKENNGSVEHSKPIWTVEIKYGKVSKFLEEIYDYLIAKKEQADVVMELRELTGGRGSRSFHLTEQFNELYIKSRLLNKRGTNPLDVEKLREDIKT